MLTWEQKEYIIYSTVLKQRWRVQQRSLNHHIVHCHFVHFFRIAISHISTPKVVKNDRSYRKKIIKYRLEKGSQEKRNFGKKRQNGYKFDYKRNGRDSVYLAIQTAQRNKIELVWVSVIDYCLLMACINYGGAKPA